MTRTHSRPLPHIAFVAADSPKARESKEKLVQLYGQVTPSKANTIVALGGDGFMLEVLHRFLGQEKRIYGMNRGSVGFMLNTYHENDLLERIEKAETLSLHPLRMRAETISGEVVDALAVNEISLLRETRQAAKLKIKIDNKIRLQELICDGALVTTAAGSTAYNLSAHGPIIPIGANILGLTPISAFRPRRWRGALLNHKAKVRFEILEPSKRPVSAVADFTEVRDVKYVDIEEERDIQIPILFDPEHNLEERIMTEQFAV